MFKHYQESRNKTPTGIFSYLIDAVWTVALTLHATLQSPDGAPLLENFQQPSQNLSEILFRELTNLSFYGASVNYFKLSPHLVHVSGHLLIQCRSLEC